MPLATIHRSQPGKDAVIAAYRPTGAAGAGAGAIDTPARGSGRNLAALEARYSRACGRCGREGVACGCVESNWHPGALGLQAMTSQLKEQLQGPGPWRAAAEDARAAAGAAAEEGGGAGAGLECAPLPRPAPPVLRHGSRPRRRDAGPCPLRAAHPAPCIPRCVA
jgi:hypothetical protein